MGGYHDLGDQPRTEQDGLLFYIRLGKCLLASGDGRRGVAEVSICLLRGTALVGTCSLGIW